MWSCIVVIVKSTWILCRKGFSHRNTEKEKNLLFVFERGYYLRADYNCVLQYIKLQATWCTWCTAKAYLSTASGLTFQISWFMYAYVFNPWKKPRRNDVRGVKDSSKIKTLPYMYPLLDSVTDSTAWLGTPFSRSQQVLAWSAIAYIYIFFFHIGVHYHTTPT